MATWHQRHARVRLDHETQWSVVTDPPNQITTIMCFYSELAAKEFAKGKPHTFVLPPRKARN